MVLTLWKNEFALHCPKCDNVFDLIWLDGSDQLGECKMRCSRCLHEFIATGKMFKTVGAEHGKLREEPHLMGESLNDIARREARE